MNILIDIGHPAHVHYFKHCTRLLRRQGHEIHLIARDRYPVQELLESEKEQYYLRGKGFNCPIGKQLYIPIADL